MEICSLYSLNILYGIDSVLGITLSCIYELPEWAID